MRTGHGEQDDISGVIEVRPGSTVTIEDIRERQRQGDRSEHLIELILRYLERRFTVRCTMCDVKVETDERGDVLDSSGRCDECRP